MNKRNIMRLHVGIENTIFTQHLRLLLMI